MRPTFPVEFQLKCERALRKKSPICSSTECTDSTRCLLISYTFIVGVDVESWISTGKIGRIGWHLAEKPDAEVTMCFRPMPPAMRPISPVEFQLKVRVRRRNVGRHGPLHWKETCYRFSSRVYGGQH